MEKQPEASKGGCETDVLEVGNRIVLKTIGSRRKHNHQGVRPVGGGTLALWKGALVTEIISFINPGNRNGVSASRAKACTCPA